MKLSGQMLSPALLLAFSSVTLASTTWYTNGVSGLDSNDCMSSTTACKTIGHAISLAASGDVIMVGAATYSENLTINISLTIHGSGTGTTIVDGGGAGRVVTIPASQVHVGLNKLTIRNGLAVFGGGISNSGTLTITNCVINGNVASGSANGGGIYNSGTLSINLSTIANNQARGSNGSAGGGIYNSGTLTLNNSAILQNKGFVISGGGGIFNGGTAAVNNSTIAANSAAVGGGISNRGTLTVSSSTINSNSATAGGNISNAGTAVVLQNSIVANSASGGNCHLAVTSMGYNLSSDSSCSFNSVGDMNSTDPLLGTLGFNGGPTKTPPLLSGSPAIDSGNPNGCTNNNGVLLKTDQRGKPRPDSEDIGGCDIGAYEFQAPLSCTPFGATCGPGLPKCCAAPFPHHSFCAVPIGQSFGHCAFN